MLEHEEPPIQQNQIYWAFIRTRSVLFACCRLCFDEIVLWTNKM